MTTNAVGIVNELSQKSGSPCEYSRGEGTGPSHAPVWSVKLMFGDWETSGSGLSVKAAKICAAKEMLVILRECGEVRRIEEEHGNTVEQRRAQLTHPPVLVNNDRFSDKLTHEALPNNTELHVANAYEIDNGGRLSTMFQEFLRVNTYFGVDTEGTDAANLPLLVQLSGGLQCWLIRLTDQRFRECPQSYPQPVQALFQDESKFKFVFGADNLGWQPKNIVDVQRAAMQLPALVEQMETMLGWQRGRLPSLCDVATVLRYNRNNPSTVPPTTQGPTKRFVKDKRLTMSTWDSGVLTEEQISYAAADACMTRWIGLHI